MVEYKHSSQKEFRCVNCDQLTDTSFYDDDEDTLHCCRCFAFIASEWKTQRNEYTKSYNDLWDMKTKVIKQLKAERDALKGQCNERPKM